jgi:5'-methylthioadenosine phosphorylase
LKKAEIAIIGGTGFENLFKEAEKLQIDTPYGTSPQFLLGTIESKNVIFLPRHGTHHSVPPHKINFRANIYALQEIGVQRVFATNAVGSINRKFKPGDLVLPHDFVDFTKNRASTFYDGAPVTHVDVSQPYCEENRKYLVKTATKLGLAVFDKAVLACTEGPRFETPGEIEAFRRLGCDIVGMTGFPEVVLARELEMCYASVCFVSNMAAGIQNRLPASEVAEVSKQIMPKLQQLLIETIRALPSEREGICPCSMALKDARFE